MDSYVENVSDGTRRLINTAFFVMVAVDENGSPAKVPPLAVESLREQAEWEAAERRMEFRKMRRKQTADQRTALHRKGLSSYDR